MPRWCPGARCCGNAGTVLQWLREAAYFLQDGMRVSCFSAEHEGEAVRGHATAGALSAEGGALSRIAGRRCGDGGEHGGHASGKRLASCRQAWCRRAAVERASVQRVGSDALRVVSNDRACSSTSRSSSERLGNHTSGGLSSRTALAVTAEAASCARERIPSEGMQTPRPRSRCVSTGIRSFLSPQTSRSRRADMDAQEAIEVQAAGGPPSAVTELFLAGCTLPELTGLGTLRPQLVPFLNLRSLSLNGCKLGSLESFPALPNLRLLELADNELT
eukprot:scaffold16052_cov51-Phaeocystis_antarctica.AAC.2